MASSVIGILTSLGLSEEDSVDQILTKLVDYNLVTTDELHNIQNISVKPLPNIVRNQADILKQRMYGIATDEDYGLPIVINRRMVLIRYILDKLNIKIDDMSENLRNGSFIVNSAYNDEDGRNIKRIYETKEHAAQTEADLAGVIITLQNNIEAGHVVAGKAVSDHFGNIINSHYETKEDASTKNTAITNQVNTLETNLENGTFVVNKATNDSQGNNINSHYETKNDASTKLAEAKNYTNSEVNRLYQLILGENYNELYNTFKEISDYILSDQTAAAQMLSKINQNTSDISTNESAITSNFNYISGVEKSLSETIERVVDAERNINALVDDKVDKVEGKQLSTNDLTNELLALLQDKYNKEQTDGFINSLNNNLQSQINEIRQILSTNDVDFDTLQELVNALKNNVANINDIFTTLNKKEDKSNLKALAYKDSLSKGDVGLENVRNVESYSKGETDAELEDIRKSIDSLSGVTGETQVQLANYYTKTQANALYDEKVDKTTTVNGHALSGNVTVTKSDVGLSNVSNDSQVKRSEMGVASGVATLDSNGKIPSYQLPSYVDDVLEYSSKSSFPTTGEVGKIYLANDKNIVYRWSGSSYVEISASLALGETSSTAYAGDKGKANATNIANILNGTTTVPKATTSTKVGTSDIGGTTTPIYLKAGVPTPLSYTISKSVPSDAKFTDTDTGATSVTTTGNGNAVTTASYDASTRKLTLTKGATFLTSHQSLANYSTLANTIKSLSISGKVITYTKGDDSTGTITTQDTNTWRGIVDNLTSTSTTESLSANQGKVLNDKFASYLTTASAAETYQPKGNYLTSIPTASTTVTGGVKVGSNITVTSGTISLTKSNVTTALGYTPPTTNTTYDVATTSANGLMSSTDKTKINYITIDTNKVVIGADSTASTYGTAVGDNATASGSYATAIGRLTEATGSHSIAIGQAYSNGNYGIAIGESETYVTSSVHGGIAIGEYAQVSGNMSIAIGSMGSDGDSDFECVASKPYTISIGNGSQAKGEYGISIGHLSSVVNTDGIAIGNGAKAEMTQSISIGTNAISNGGSATISIGQNSNGGYSGIAIGNSASGGYYGVAIGNGAVSSAQRGIAIGPGVTSGSSGSSGYVKIGSSSNPYYYAGASTSWTASSDIRDKINITDMINCQELINRINPIYYNYNRRRSYSENCSLLDYDKEQYEKGTFAEENITLGFRAQEVATALEELYGDECFGNIIVHEFEEDKETGQKEDAYFMNNAELIPVIVGALKEQQMLIKNLIARIEQLEKK